MGLYAIDETYSLATWYENSGAFDLNTGTDLLLDLTREILNSDNYVCQLVAFPKAQDIVFANQQSFSGSLNLVPYSFVVGLCGFNDAANQFTLRIYDKGAQTDLYYGQFAWFPSVIGIGQDQVSTNPTSILSDKDKPFGPYFFRAPWIILPPGVLQIQITNVSPNSVGPVDSQLLFMTAVPKTTVTLANRRVVTGRDQTGLETLIGSLSNLVGG